MIKAWTTMAHKLAVPIWGPSSRSSLLSTVGDFDQSLYRSCSHGKGSIFIVESTRQNLHSIYIASQVASWHIQTQECLSKLSNNVSDSWPFTSGSGQGTQPFLQSSETSTPMLTALASNWKIGSWSPNLEKGSPKRPRPGCATDSGKKHRDVNHVR